MDSSLAFLLGLLDRHFPAAVSWEDFQGEHGSFLRLCQQMGFLSRDPGMLPVPSCPRCCDGEPQLLAGRYLCSSCHSAVAREHLLLWRFDLDAFLHWLACRLNLTDDVRQIDESCWQLGRFVQGESIVECFFLRGKSLSAHGHSRIRAYHNTLLFTAISQEMPIAEFRGPCLTLLELLLQDHYSIQVRDMGELLQKEKGIVRFDDKSGVLWVGDSHFGEIPPGTREFYMLMCLSDQLDRFVSYGDLKYDILRRSGLHDSTDEATFCHNLKRRIKKKGWVPRIDALLVTTGKGDGYRLRGVIEV